MLALITRGQWDKHVLILRPKSVRVEIQNRPGFYSSGASSMFACWPIMVSRSSIDGSKEVLPAARSPVDIGSRYGRARRHG